MNFILGCSLNQFKKNCTLNPKRCLSLKNPWNSDDKIKFTLRRHKGKLVGALGATSILLTSYILTRKYTDEEITQKNISTYERKPDYMDDLVRNNNATYIAQQSKDEQTNREKFNFINNVVRRCASAVFYLEIRDPTKKDPETGEPLITSNGSGFVISDDGWALTNAHVVLNKTQCTITAIFRDGKSYPARIEDADINMDLALLKVNAPEALPSLTFGDSEETSVGEWVVALGSPLSLSNSVTVGIVSCVNRPAEDLGLKNYSMTYIQTDASITFGNSGGPLVNLDGNVIGINNLRLTSGISFAIPVEYARKFLENSKFKGKGRELEGIAGKTLLGMTTITVNLDVINDLLRENKDVPEEVTQGLLVWKLLQDTPAQLSGMEVGDIITRINGVPVKEAADVYFLSREKRILEIELFHDGKKKIVFVDTAIEPQL